MKKKCISIALIMVLMLGILAGCTDKTAKVQANEEEDYTPVEIETVDMKTISNQTILSGTVNVNKEVNVVPKTPGKLTQINVKVGTYVNEGTVLFTLDREDIEKQVQQAKKSMDAASVNYEKTKEQIENAKANLERTKQLYEQGAVSLNQYEQAQLTASDSTMNAVQVQYEQAELVYNQALDSLKNTSVTSPIKGIVSMVNVEEGEMASTAQPVVVVVDLSKLYIKIDVPENIISKLAIGQVVMVDIPSASEKSITGRIETISPTVDQTTRMYSIDIYIENSEQVIKAGMFANVHLNTDTKENVIAVKSEAVLEKNNKYYVYVLEEDKAVEKEVTVGLDTGDYAEISKGLEKGEIVLTKGQHYVQNGSKVKVIRGDK